MEIRASFLIPPMIKAMMETVLPAVDPENKLAVEQARIVIGLLQMMASRLPLEFRYDRDELARSIELAGRLRECANGSSRTAEASRDLTASAKVGAEILGRAGAEPDELTAAVRDLRSKVGALVEAVSEDGDGTLRAAVRRAVLDASREQNERERAWLLPQGWEARPAALRPIEALLSDRAKP